MSKQHCPVCGQVALGRKAAKRVRKWVDESRLDHFMYDKLMQLVKAKMYGGEKQLREADEERLVAAANALPVEKRTDERGRPLPRKALREQHHRRMDTLRQGNPLGWAGMFGGTDIVQPVKRYDEILQEDLQRYKNEKSEARRQRKRESNRRWLARHPNYSRDYYARKKAEAEAAESGAEVEDELGDNALDYAEKQNEKLARDREYQRKYYAKNKERIDRLRKQRAARQAAARRSPNTGEKANGH